MFKKLIKKAYKNKKGFTLIELIVVIAILGILAAILIPSVTNIIGTAQTNTDKANARIAYMQAQVILANNLTVATPVTYLDGADTVDGSLAKAVKAAAHTPTGSVVTIILSGTDSTKTISTFTYVPRTDVTAISEP